MGMFGAESGVKKLGFRLNRMLLRLRNPLTRLRDLAPGNDECAICLQKFKPSDELRLLRCPGSQGHAFHAECIDRWSLTSTRCPLCNHTSQLLKTPLLSSEPQVTGNTVGTSQDIPEPAEGA